MGGDDRRVLRSFGPSDALDVAIVALLLRRHLSWLRRSQAALGGAGHRPTRSRCTWARGCSSLQLTTWVFQGFFAVAGAGAGGDLPGGAAARLRGAGGVRARPARDAPARALDARRACWPTRSASWRARRSARSWCSPACRSSTATCRAGDELGGQLSAAAAREPVRSALARPRRRRGDRGPQRDALRRAPAARARRRACRARSAPGTARRSGCPSAPTRSAWSCRRSAATISAARHGELRAGGVRASWRG